MRKSRTPAGFVPKPLRNCSRKNPETLLLPKRCFWNPLKTKKKARNPPLESLRHRLEIRPLVRQTGARMRKSRTPAGFVPKPLRNCSLKNPETLLLEPTKNKEIVPKPCETARQTFAQRKTWKPASHQAKLKKMVFGTRMRKSRTPAGFVPKPLGNCSLKNPETLLLEPIKNKEIVPKPLRNYSLKNPETLLLEPTKNKEKGPKSSTRIAPTLSRKEIVPKPCETAARKMPKRCFWNPLKTKKKV